jgi:SAM-dependent methyltransferase
MMYVPGHADHYLSVGLSAVRCINKVIESVEKWPTPKTILDFPCGHGRVTRFLTLMFPAAEITGAEIDLGCLDFCKREFGIRPFESRADLASVFLPKTFDLIWCGSLLTHINEDAQAALLRLFCTALSDKGICIFTTHGWLFAEYLRTGINNYGLPSSCQQRILREFAEKGFGFVEYAEGARIGISVAQPSHMMELARSAGAWFPLLLIERGWDNHQDVYAFSKAAPAHPPAIDT